MGRRCGKSKRQLCKKIHLSRPTMYQYMDAYEHGERITRERYEIIFHRLFDDENISPDDFADELNSIELLFERDERFQIEKLNPGEADYAYETYKLISEDLQTEDYDKYIYLFINNLLTSYRKGEFWRMLAHYVCTLNGISALEDVKEEEKPYFAEFYKMFSKIVNGTGECKKEDYSKFVKRCRELQQERKWLDADLKQEISSIMQEIMQENKRTGIEMDRDQLLKSVKERI